MRCLSLNTSMFFAIQPLLYSPKYPMYYLLCQKYYQNAIGTLTFITGMVINITSDLILRNLRKNGKSDYKIPYGGLFEYVSGANYFGECIEWAGYALVTRTLPAFAFAFFTLCNLAPRAYQHHR